MFDVAVLGRSVWDAWQDIPVSADDSLVYFGGPAANVAVVLSALGLKCTLVTELGNDDRSTRYRRYLNDLGIDLSLASSCAGALPTCRMWVGRRGAYAWETADHGVQVTESHVVSSAAAVSRSLFFADVTSSGVVSRELAQSSASAPQMTLWSEEQAQVGFLKHPWRAVFLNRKEADKASSALRLSLPSLSLLNPGTALIVTDAGQPVSVWRSGIERLFPVKAVNPLSAVGAGDGFAAGVWAGLYRGLQIDRAVELGIAVASLVIHQVGCQLRTSEVHPIGTRFGMQAFPSE